MASRMNYKESADEDNLKPIFKKATRKDYASAARISSEDNEEIREALNILSHSIEQFKIEKALQVITFYTQYIPCIDQNELIAEKIFGSLVEHMSEYQNVYKIFMFLVFTVPRDKNPVFNSEIYDIIIENIYQNRKCTVLVGIFELLDAIFTIEDFGFSVLEYFVSKGILDLLSQQLEYNSSTAVISMVHKLVSTIIQLARINQIELSSFIPFLENMLRSANIFTSDRIDICYALLALSDNEEVFAHIAESTEILPLLQDILESGPTKDLSPLFAIILKFAEQDQYNDIFLNQEFFTRIEEFVLDPTFKGFDIVCHYLYLVREKFRDVYEEFGYNVFITVMKNGSPTQKLLAARYIFDDIDLLLANYEFDAQDIINESIVMLSNMNELDTISILDKLFHFKYQGEAIPYNEELFIDSLTELCESDFEEIAELATLKLNRIQNES